MQLRWPVSLGERASELIDPLPGLCLLWGSKSRQAWQTFGRLRIRIQSSYAA